MTQLVLLMPTFASKVFTLQSRSNDSANENTRGAQLQIGVWRWRCCLLRKASTENIDVTTVDNTVENFISVMLELWTALEGRSLNGRHSSSRIELDALVKLMLGDALAEIYRCLLAMLWSNGEVNEHNTGDFSFRRISIQKMLAADFDHVYPIRLLPNHICKRNVWYIGTSSTHCN